MRAADDPHVRRWSERSVIAFAVAAPTTVVLSHGLAAVLAGVTGVGVASSAALLGPAAVAIAVSALLGTVGRPSRWRPHWRWALVLGTATVGGIVVSLASPAPGAVRVLLPALLGTGGVTPLVLGAISSRIPSTWDGAATRRPGIAGAWALLALLALLETMRVSTFMSNPDEPGAADWMLQRVADHSCMAGYVYAAELNRRGHPNIYDVTLYPLGTPGVHARPEPGIASDATTVANLAPHVLDNYQYPPPFLLLPRAALALNNDFLQMRTVWFAMQWLGLLAVTLALAHWVGGKTGAIMWLLVPVLMVSGPTSLGLQRGQFHPGAWALVIGAMLAFEHRRNALGGAMLSFTVMSKIFPGVLGIYLILTRRWAAVAWTLAAAAGWLVLSLLVLGWAPFERFGSYQLPRIASGDAFAWCFERLTCITNNQAPFGLPFKLSALGVLSDPAPVGAVIHTLYPVVVAAIAIWAGLRAPTSGSNADERVVRARAWTSLAMLASLTPDLVPATYSPFGTFLTLMLVTGQVRTRTGAVLVGLAWLAAFQLPASPTSSFKVALSAITALILLGVNVWVAATAKREPTIPPR
jgi:hypothetical protein